MKVVLFDRDGTLIVDPADERVDSEAKIQLFADTISALKKLADNGFSAVIITNQAGIAEGRIDVAEFERINSTVIKQLETSGIKIPKTYMCPHALDDGCDCRKPKPTMILLALADFGLNPAKTFMVGDHRSDVLASKKAGVRSVLVHTANRPDPAPEADYQAQSLTEAVDIIIKKS